MAWDILGEEKHLRASSSRRLQGKHLSARGMGAGFGYGFGESTGIAESQQRMTGMNGMFGFTTGGRAAIASKTREVLSTDLETGSHTLSNITQGPNLQRLIELTKARDWRKKNGRDAGGRDTRDIDAEMTVQKSEMAAAGVADLAKNKAIPGKETRGLLKSAMQMAGHGIDMGAAQQSLSEVFASTGSRGAAGAEKSMQLFERAIERGTTKGFTDSRVQEELVTAIAQGAHGMILGDGGKGLERFSSFLTGGGAPGDKSVADISARKQAMNAFESMNGNGFFQGVNVASAKNILGKDANARQLMAFSGAGDTELLTGSKRLDAAGVNEDMRLKGFHARIQSKISAYASTDPELAAQLKRSGGDLSKVDGGKMFSVRRNLRGFNTDQSAQAAADMVQGMGDMSNLSNVKGKRLKSTVDGLAVAAISTEETAKMKILGKEVAEEMAKTFAAIDKKKSDELIEGIQKGEQDGKNFDLKEGKMFVVRLISSVNAADILPAGARNKVK